VRVLVYGVTQWEGQLVEIDGEDYRIVSVEPAPEVGYDGLNRWEGSGGVFSARAHWVTVERLTPEESQAWATEEQAAIAASTAKMDRPWWRLWG
jgi:hypothetical protein